MAKHAYCRLAERAERLAHNGRHANTNRGPMIINLRLALLDIAQSIGRDLRPADPEDSISYPHAIETLGDLEDKLTALAELIPESSGLSGRPNGYLPSRHPKALANTLAGLDASIQPALRPASQSEDFDS